MCCTMKKSSWKCYKKKLKIKNNRSEFKLREREEFLHLFYLRFIKFLEQKSAGKKSLMRPVRHNKAIAQSHSQSSNARLWPQIYAIQL